MPISCISDSRTQRSQQQNPPQAKTDTATATATSTMMAASMAADAGPVVDGDGGPEAHAFQVCVFVNRKMDGKRGWVGGW